MRGSHIAAIGHVPHAITLPSIIPPTQSKLIAAVHERLALKLTAEAVVFVLRAEPYKNVHKMAIKP